ncbi:S-layer homology domain-containing protein [Caldicellulosiruptor acetigenus]|uniref:S-layer homology domain-containing protein n=1 Tax=Caldicellulosiruptor acetigenus TaxID=301953 RepID=UPI0002FC8C25|nr:S-layer homology domain-containing protein [Caldicellulosiruptor acetigenus]
MKAKISIQRCVSEGFVQGSNGSLKPQEYASRAEVAVIIYRLVNSYYIQQLK